MHQIQTTSPVGDAPVRPGPTASLRDGDRRDQGPLFTAEEYGLYRAELTQLRRIRDRDLPTLLRDARGFVANDAAEEILQIQDDQAVVEVRIARLESLLRDATIVSSADLAGDVAAVGRVVDVGYASTGKVATYRLGGTGAADGRTVSARSPVGSALLGRVPGDLVEVELPDGRIEQLQILAVRQPEDGASA